MASTAAARAAVNDATATCEERLGGAIHIIDRKAELREQILERCGSAEMAAGNDRAVKPDIAPPAQRGAGFHCQALAHCGGQNLLAIFARLVLEQLV